MKKLASVGAVPQQVAFGGHETFVLRYPWLKKAVEAVGTNASIFGSATAMVELGVGKNMVRSIRFWGLSSGVLEEVPKTRGVELKVSDFGRVLFADEGLDPFLEDPASLWLLHWKIANSERRATTWCWAFNGYSSLQLTRNDLVTFLNDELNRRNLDPPSSDTLRRDVDCFVRTYTSSRRVKQTVLEDSLDSPLVELGIIRGDAESETFKFQRGPKSSLPDSIFLFALLDFWQTHSKQRETLAFSEVAYGFGSPGMIFRLDEDSLTVLLERLELMTKGKLVYGETAGLKQIYRRTAVDQLAVLADYYDDAHSISALLGA